jgi:hypothetical protein
LAIYSSSAATVDFDRLPDVGDGKHQLRMGARLDVTPAFDRSGSSEAAAWSTTPMSGARRLPPVSSFVTAEALELEHGSSEERSDEPYGRVIMSRISPSTIRIASDIAEIMIVRHPLSIDVHASDLPHR